MSYICFNVSFFFFFLLIKNDFNFYKKLIKIQVIHIKYKMVQNIKEIKLIFSRYHATQKYI